MISNEVLDAMLAAGCTAEQIVAAVKADNDAEMAAAPARSSRQERNARYYQNRKERLNASYERLKTSEQDEKVSPTSAPLVPPPLEPPPYNPPTTTPSKTSPSSANAIFKSEFESQFWPIYPNKVGKPKAFDAFVKARKKTNLATILEGLSAYVGKMDDRPWCNPSTWLNQERWGDEPAAIVQQRSQAPPPRQSAAAQRREEDLAYLDSLLGVKPRDEFDGFTLDLSANG